MNRVPAQPSSPKPNVPSSTSPTRPSRLVRFAILLVFLATILVSFGSRDTSAPLGNDAPRDGFSASRATAAATPVVSAPRPIGSPENAAARTYLTERLGEMNFEVTRHEEISTRRGQEEHTGESTAAFTRNLLATRQGTDPTGTIVLATHLDSVAAAPGAADAGIGIAVILETVRALGPEAQRNDLVVLLVDGEEDGLLGSRAMVKQNAEHLAEPVVVLNHEARGTSGRPTVARWNGPMHEIMPSMPHPEAESFTGALFTLLPNDTDFTEYREGDWWGIDMAIAGDSWAYHTPQDDLAHLDRSTVQHFGEMTLAMTNELLGRDLGALDAGEAAPVSTTAPWGILEVPTGLLLVLAIAAPLTILLGLGITARRGIVQWGATLLAALGALLGVALGTAAAIAAWAAASALRPEMLSVVVGEPVIAWPFLAAEAVVAIGACLLVRAVLGRWMNRAELVLGAALMVSLLAGVVTILMPELGGWLMLPVSAAALGTLGTVVVGTVVLGAQESAVRPRRILRLSLGIAATLPMAWVLGTQLSASSELGIRSSNGMIAITVLLSLFAVLPLLLGLSAGTVTEPAGKAGIPAGTAVAMLSGRAPVPPRRSSPPHLTRRLLAPVAVFVLAIVCSGVGLLIQPLAAEPTQERVSAEVDTDAGETKWSAAGTTRWGRALDGTTAGVQGQTAPRCVSVPTSDAESTTGAAATPSSEPTADGRTIRLEVSSPRDAQRLTLSPVGGTMQDIRVDGTEVPAEPGGSTSLRLLGLEPGQNLVIEFAVSPEASALTCTDETHDPSAVPGWTPAPDSVSLVQPAVRVTGTTSL